MIFMISDRVQVPISGIREYIEALVRKENSTLGRVCRKLIEEAIDFRENPSDVERIKELVQDLSLYQLTLLQAEVALLIERQTPPIDDPISQWIRNSDAKRLAELSRIPEERLLKIMEGGCVYDHEATGLLYAGISESLLRQAIQRRKIYGNRNNSKQSSFLPTTLPGVRD